MSALSAPNLYLVELRGGWHWEGDTSELVFSSVEKSEAIKVAKQHYLETEAANILDYDYFRIIVRETQLGFNTAETIVWNSNKEIEQVQLGHIVKPNLTGNLSIMWDDSVPLEPSKLVLPFYKADRSQVMVSRESLIKDTIISNHISIEANELEHHFYQKYEI